MPRRKHDPRTVYTVVFYDEAGEVVLTETRKAYGPEDVCFQARQNMPLGAARYEPLTRCWRFGRWPTTSRCPCGPS